jgi:uncharacterized protein (TIGR02646 family)
VKRILKDPEPECLIEWKRENKHLSPTFRDDFQNPQKKDTHCALIREQGYTCCYCQCRIERRSSHIEHFKPISMFPGLQLDYQNLHASCECGGHHPGQSECDEPILADEIEEDFEGSKHCGRFKGNEYNEDLISPLDPDCESYFYYNRAGEIKPSKDPEKSPAAKITIDALGLDSKSLTLRRKKALDGALLDIDSLSTEEVRQLIDGFNQKDKYGLFIPFCAAIAYVLGSYLIP